MYDGLKLRIITICSMRDYKEIFMDGYDWHERQNRHTGQKTYHWNVKGLYCKLNYREDELTVHGSIHKYLKHENYSDFSPHEITQALSWLCVDLMTTLKRMEIMRLEFGVNLQLSDNPNSYLKLFREYKGRPFYNMQPKMGSTEILGINCLLKVYSIKVYNKGEDHRISNGIPKKNYSADLKKIIRIELKYKSTKLQSLFKSKVTAEHLISKAALSKVSSEFLNVFKMITLVNREYDWKAFSPKYIKEIKFLLSDEYANYLDIMRKRSTEERKAESKRLKDLKSKMEGAKLDLAGEITDKIETKLKLWG